MENVVSYLLPLTTSTGKARVKRRKDDFGEPIPVTGEGKFGENDYIEWQISYFVALDTLWDTFRKEKNLTGQLAAFDEMFSFFKSDALVSELKDFIRKNSGAKRSEFKEGLKKIFQKHNEIIITKEHKDNKDYVMYELADLFRSAIRQKIISKAEIQELIKFNDSGKIDIEAQYKIKRRSLDKVISEGFKCYEENYPLFIKEFNGKSFAEIILKHKQRAVGYQSMIYFCVYLKHLTDAHGNSVIGRSADSKECVQINITKEELFGIAKSFIIASSDHAWDMKKILAELIK